MWVGALHQGVRRGCTGAEGDLGQRRGSGTEHTGRGRVRTGDLCIKASMDVAIVTPHL